MIIANGTIEVKKMAGGGLDANGLRQASSVSWGEPVACQYSIVRHDRQAEADGERYTLASYRILIDEDDAFDGESVRLKDCAGNVVGDYGIIYVRPLETVCEIEILV